MFFTHVPAPIRAVLAGFDLEQNWVSGVEKVDKNVNLGCASRSWRRENTPLQKS
jgi:hypothetical protein